MTRHSGASQPDSRAPTDLHPPDEGTDLFVTHSQLDSAISRIQSTHYNKETLKTGFVQRPALRQELEILANKGSLIDFARTLDRKLKAVREPENAQASHSASPEKKRRRKADPDGSERRGVQNEDGSEHSVSAGTEHTRTASTANAAAWASNPPSLVDQRMGSLKMHIDQLHTKMGELELSASAVGRALRQAEDCSDRLDQLEQQAKAPSPQGVGESDVQRMLNVGFEVYSVRSPLAARTNELAGKVESLKETSDVVQRNLDRQQARTDGLQATVDGFDDKARVAVRELRARIEKAEGAIDSTGKDIKENASRIDSLAADLTQLDQNLAQAEGLVTNFIDKGEAAAQNVKALVAKVEAGSAEQALVTSSQAKAERRTEELDRRLCAIEATQTEERGERSLLSSSVGDLRAAQAELSAARDQVDAKLDQLSQKQSGDNKATVEATTTLDLRVQRAIKLANEAKLGASWATIKPVALADVELVLQTKVGSMLVAVNTVKGIEPKLRVRMDDVQRECMATAKEAFESLRGPFVGLRAEMEAFRAEAAKAKWQGQQILQVMHGIGLDLAKVGPALGMVAGFAAQSHVPNQPLGPPPTHVQASPLGAFGMAVRPPPSLRVRAVTGSPWQPMSAGASCHTPPLSPPNAARPPSTTSQNPLAPAVGFPQHTVAGRSERREGPSEVQGGMEVRSSEARVAQEEGPAGVQPNESPAGGVPGGAAVEGRGGDGDRGGSEGGPKLPVLVGSVAEAEKLAAERAAIDWSGGQGAGPGSRGRAQTS